MKKRGVRSSTERRERESFPLCLSCALVFNFLSLCDKKMM